MQAERELHDLDLDGVLWGGPGDEPCDAGTGAAAAMAIVAFMAFVTGLGVASLTLL
jgi:hypothetical protein